MVKCAIYQASKSIFDRTLFIRVSFRTCVCLVWREKGGEDKRHVRASRERSGNEFGHVFWRRPDRRRRRRFSQAECRVVGVLSGGRGGQGGGAGYHDSARQR
jgi:hypothetical protein